MKLPGALLALLVAVAPASGTDSHPIESVIKLLKNLELTVESEGEAEQATFMKFHKWCGDNIADTEMDQGIIVKAVKSDAEDIDTLTDLVSAKEKERDEIEENIEFLTGEIAKYEAEDVAAKEARDDANKVYKAADKDFETTLKAVDDAIDALVKSKAASLAQFLKPENSRQEQALRALIQQPLVLEQLSDEQRDALSAAVYGTDTKPVTEADILAKAKYAKAGNTYTFKSGNVIDLLRSLKTHFANEKTASTKSETAEANAYEVAKDARKAALAAAGKAKEGKTTELGETKKDLNTAQSDLKDEKDELAADSKTLKNTQTTCALKTSEFKERSEIRQHEREAMKAAIEILAEVSGVRTGAPKNKALPAAPKLFLLQVDDPKMKAVNLLRQEATETHSKQLKSFAEQLAASLDGPFDAVNQMVQKMIFRLMDEQKKEDEHKLWCDQEISVSETSEKDKTNKVKSLDAKIKDAKAHVDELVIKIEDLDKKVVKLTEFMADATEIRKEGKAENKRAIQDAEDAQAAIAKAVAVLEAFYKDSGMVEKEAWEFLQAPEPAKLGKQPSTWGASYTGTTDPNNKGGVLSVLQATAADFSKMEADTRAQEVSDQEQFDSDMQSAAIEKAKSSKESEMKADEKKRTQDSVNSMTKQKKHVASELGAVKTYLKDLAKPCLDGDSKYEDRKAARTSEIESLRKAQVILQNAFEDKAALLQTIQKH